jgi:hypothetical protein
MLNYNIKNIARIILQQIISNPFLECLMWRSCLSFCSSVWDIAWEPKPLYKFFWNSVRLSLNVSSNSGWNETTITGTLHCVSARILNIIHCAPTIIWAKNVLNKKCRENRNISCPVTVFRKVWTQLKQRDVCWCVVTTEQLEWFWWTYIWGSFHTFFEGLSVHRSVSLFSIEALTVGYIFLFLIRCGILPLKWSVRIFSHIDP